MFFIMGISDKNIKLDFDQLVICKCCGKYGHIEVFMTYTYFMFFFIPIVKWNKRYYVKMSCCNSVSEIPRDIGEAIKTGTITHIDECNLSFGHRENSVKHCSKCGFTTTEDYEYCPKCGNKI